LGEYLMSEPETPYFLIRERDMLTNLDKIGTLRRMSGAKVLLALKCFSTWGIFPILRGALDGTVASSPYEARLGAETFGGETQIYSPGYSRGDIREVEPFADKVVFNSISQWERFRQLLAPAVPVGMRINPEVSYSRSPMADPARPGSRLGVRLEQWEAHGAIDVSGVMLHMNCDNDDFRAVSHILDVVSDRFEKLLEPMQWVSLGGGVLFTADGYPLERFGHRLAQFADRHGVQLYVEPGEAVVSGTTDLVVTVLDVVETAGGLSAAVVDAGAEAHRLDTLMYDEPAQVAGDVPNGPNGYTISGRSCLAGDQFGTAHFDEPLRVGDRLHLLNSGGYSMVKANWFNGLRMPSVYCERTDGRLQLVSNAGYEEFRRAGSTKSISEC
jgi:carboxynorspermidine decarboxylase